MGQHIAELMNRRNEFHVAIGDITDNPKGNYPFIQLDVLDRDSVSKAISDFDLMVNCTGQITRPINTCFRLNTSGIMNIIEPVLKYDKKLVHLSTVSVYGTCEVADETSELNPENPYAACKSFAEYCISSHLPVKNYSILRLSNLYGEDQPKGFFAYLQKSFHSDQKLEFNNDGSLSRYFLHVNDCSRAVLLAVKKNLNGIYNVSGFEKYSIREIIRKVESYTGIPFDPEFASLKPVGNIDVLKSELFTSQTGFRPLHSIDDIIQAKF